MKKKAAKPVKQPLPVLPHLSSVSATVGEVREWATAALQHPRKKERAIRLLERIPAHWRWEELPFRCVRAAGKVERLADQTVILSHLRMLSPDESRKARLGPGVTCSPKVARMLGLMLCKVDGKTFFVKCSSTQLS